MMFMMQRIRSMMMDQKLILKINYGGGSSTAYPIGDNDWINTFIAQYEFLR